MMEKMYFVYGDGHIEIREHIQGATQPVIFSPPTYSSGNWVPSATIVAILHPDAFNLLKKFVVENLKRGGASDAGA